MFLKIFISFRNIVFLTVFCLGQCDVNAMMMLLVQEMIYTCNPGEDSKRRKKEVMVVSEIRDEADYNPGETKVTIHVQMSQTYH